MHKPAVNPVRVCLNCGVPARPTDRVCEVCLSYRFRQSYQCRQCGLTFETPTCPTCLGGPVVDDSTIELAVEEHRPGGETPEPRAKRTPVRRRRRHTTLPAGRGNLILGLGVLSLVLCGLSILLGPMAWFMGSSDLQEIRAGRLDPRAEGLTRAGQICGMIGTVLGLLQLICGCGWLLVMLTGR